VQKSRKRQQETFIRVIGERKKKEGERGDNDFLSAVGSLQKCLGVQKGPGENLSRYLIWERQKKLGEVKEGREW